MGTSNIPARFDDFLDTVFSEELDNRIVYFSVFENVGAKKSLEDRFGRWMKNHTRNDLRGLHIIWPIPCFGSDRKRSLGVRIQWVGISEFFNLGLPKDPYRFVRTDAYSLPK